MWEKTEPHLPRVSIAPESSESPHRMANITIYTTLLCPYCVMAKRLLKQKGVVFDEVNIGLSSSKRAEMRERAGGSHTVPQIFIGENYVGGCDQLYELDRQGRLDSMLEAA
ncbi:MAG: glutaredoxin 3 [Hyphomicrobiaceae bacterium]